MVCCNHSNDLVEVAMKHTRWINIYPGSGGETKAKADAMSNNSRIACIEVTFTEGEGLNRD